jgi:hypothetical protein
MEDAKVLRFEKGTQSPAVKGQGSIYVIPADDVPDGMTSGEKMKVIIEGLVNIDEQGAIINVDRIYIDRSEKKYTDPTQDSLEAGFKDEMSKNK